VVRVLSVFLLESQSKAVNTKYRSVKTVLGNPGHFLMEKDEPRRSQLSLEAFRVKKLEENASIEPPPKLT
jgi:hypothetical protein